MAIYQDSQQLYDSMKTFFRRIGEEYPSAAGEVSKAKLIIRLSTSAPPTAITLNGRKTPPEVSYGDSTLRPDLAIDLTAEALHYILLGELSLTKALASGQLKVSGPVWKSFVLEGVFHHGQAIYPQILKEMGMDGRT
jgi:putative sterol carrier protein